MRISAGLLLYRRKSLLEVLLVHPGGPVWTKRDVGAWSIPKGEVIEGEELLAVARREFEEELGVRPQASNFIPLGSITQKGGKVVHAWAFEGDLDTSAVKSNTFQMEWPPRSGRQAEFPEVDRAEWFDIATAKKKILQGQLPFIGELVVKLAGRNR